MLPARLPNRFYGHSPERGLLVIDRNGVTYLSLAQSQIVKGLSFLEMLLGTAAIASISVFTELTWLFFGALALVPAIWLCSLPFSTAMRERALAKEEQIRSGGTSLASAAVTERQFLWHNVAEVSVYPGRRDTAEIVVKLAEDHRQAFHLLSGDEVLGISSCEQAAKLAEAAVNHYAPGKLTH